MEINPFLQVFFRGTYVLGKKPCKSQLLRRDTQELEEGLKRDKIVQLIHLLRFDGVCYIDVGFHGGIVGMAGPLHHDVDRNAGRQ